jgi:AGCS family alanine or glycine:cation symporter
MAYFTFWSPAGYFPSNYNNIIPSFVSLFSTVFYPGTAATERVFLGATIAFAINRGVNRGLFSNESGQGSAPIAHSAARAPEPVSEGMVAILEPFIDTIIICTLTGLVILSSGVWTEKIDNQFQSADMIFLCQQYDENIPEQKQVVTDFIVHKKPVPLFNGEIEVIDGKMITPITLISSRSVAEDFNFYDNGSLINRKYSGCTG